MKSISISAKAIFSATLFSVGLFISAKASALPAQLFFECAANLKEEISVTVVTDAEEFNHGFHDLAATVEVFENGVLKFSTSSATIGERLPVLVDDGQILWAMDVAVDATKEESIQMGFDPVSESWYLGVNVGGVVLDSATSVGSVSCRAVDDSGLSH
jgi:hypothetical protein